MSPCRWIMWGTASAASLIVHTAVSAAEHPLTLADAVSDALRRGPAARIASLEAGRAEDALAEARSAYFPHVSISSQAGYSNRLDEKLRTVDAKGREREYGLSSLGSDTGWFNFYIDQLLFDLQTWRGVERAALSAEAGRVAEAEKREAISLAVITHYAEALRFEQIAALDERRLVAAEDLDALAESLLAAGRIVASEREQATLALATLRMHATTHAGARTDARRALANATGADPDEAVQLAPDSLPAVAHTAADLEGDEVLAGAPELQLLGLRKRMEDVSVAAARAERYPTIGLRAGYSNYGVRRGDNFPDELRVGVDLRMPLFDGYKARHSIAGALKGAEIARLRYDSMLERKRARVRQLSRELAVAVRKPALASRRAAIADERLRLVEVRLRNDRGTLTEMLEASDGWGRDAHVAIEAEFDAVVLWATLQREIGQLAATILGPPTGEVSPTPGDGEQR